MHAFGRTVLLAATLMSSPGMADEIRVLSVAAVQNAVRALAADFSKETGSRVALTFAPPVAVMQKIKAGELFDALIVPEAAMDKLDGDGIVNPESRVRLASTGLGVAIRADASAPDLSSPEAFKQALLAAKSVAYTDPSLPYQSGEKIEKILAKAGVLEGVKPKARIAATLAPSQEMVAKGEAEIGIYNVSEIPDGKGLKYAGPVPAPLQMHTHYEGAVTSDGSAPETARKFIRFLAGEEARGHWLAAKLDPAEP